MTESGFTSLDLVPFGRTTWTAAGEPSEQSGPEPNPGSAAGRVRHVGVEWERPQALHAVVVDFAEQPAHPDAMHLEYWQSSWPTVHPDSLPGTFRGWIPVDDAYHGRWVRARGAWDRQGSSLVYTFDPLDLTELAGFESPRHLGGSVGPLDLRAGYRATFRKTLKLRVTVREDAAELTGVKAFSDAVLVPTRLAVRVTESHNDWHPDVEVDFGELLQVTSSEDRYVIDLLATRQESGDPASTLVTIVDPDPADRHASGFTVDVADVLAGPIWMADSGAYVTDADNDVSIEEHRKTFAGDMNIFDRVEDCAEQTYRAAREQIPPLDVTTHLDVVGQPPSGRYIVLGETESPFKFGVKYNGEIFADKAMMRLNNRTTAPLAWAGDRIQVRFGCGTAPDFRERVGATAQELVEGHLPAVHSRWSDGAVDYLQRVFVRGVDEDGAEDASEPPVLFVSMTAKNTGQTPCGFELWIHLPPDEELRLGDDGALLAVGRYVRSEEDPGRAGLLDTYDTPVVRAVLAPSPSPLEGDCALTVGTVSGGIVGAENNAVRWTGELQPSAEAAVDVRVPMAPPEGPEGVRGLQEVDFDSVSEATLDRWRARLSASTARIHLPEDESPLEDFIKALPWHLWMSAVKDSVTGQVSLPAGSLFYGPCGNEAVWQTRALDHLGFHADARAYLETLLSNQGTVKPDGAFQSAEGALQAVAYDMGEPAGTMFAYNLDHGVILQGCAEHYLMTGDDAWLRSVADQLIAGCDFIIRERSATEGHDDRSRGLLPAGHLEDNPEWRHWFAVNSHAHGGLARVAEALTLVNHESAGRITAAAEAFRADIQRAVRAASVYSPVVRLRDGVAVPHVPPRAHLRGREYGWIREVAEGALQLWDGAVFPAGAPEISFALRDLEDNLFLSDHYGWGTSAEADWFSRGGVTSQPSLLPIGMCYLERDEIKHALRSLYNNIAMSFYEDVRCMAEWVPAPGWGGGPFFKGPDEARVVTFIRNHLLFEQEDTLWLGKGAPSSWLEHESGFGVSDLPSRFGKVSYRIERDGSSARARAACRFDLRRLPGRVLVRFRHPDDLPIQTALVNGNEALVIGSCDVEIPLAEINGAELDVTADFG